jgi:hypothetical protein
MMIASEAHEACKRHRAAALLWPGGESTSPRCDFLQY